MTTHSAPSGLRTRRQWLKTALAAGVVVSLGRWTRAAPVSPDLPPIRILFFTDVHAGLDDSTAEPLALAARVLNTLPADVTICGGDVIHRGYLLPEAECAPRFAQYRQFLEDLDHPVEHVIGNHDLAGAFPPEGEQPAADPRAIALRELQIPNGYRTFDRAGYRFIILDSVELLGGDLKYRGFIDPTQMQWLAEVVKDWPAEKPFVLVSHIPFRSTFLQATENPGAPLPENLVVANANEVLELFEDRNLPLVLQGHLHSNELINWSGRHFIMGGAICGAWWRGPNRQTDFGFGLISIADGQIHWDYRGFGWNAPENQKI